MAERPGMMVYFDTLDSMKRMDDKTRGRLFLAMLEYGRDGTEPQFDDMLLDILWPMMKSKLDTDSVRYRSVRQQRRYASYCSLMKQRRRQPLDYEQWLASEGAEEESRRSGTRAEPDDADPARSGSDPPADAAHPAADGGFRAPNTYTYTETDTYTDTDTEPYAYTYTEAETEAEAEAAPRGGDFRQVFHSESVENSAGGGFSSADPSGDYLPPSVDLFEKRRNESIERLAKYCAEG